jgi:ABC-type multidrug transport system fused ATPase/permease subunit
LNSHEVLSLSLSFTHTSNRGCYLGIYAILGVVRIFFILFTTLTVAIAGIKASRTLHYRMLKNILRSPMSFFDTTPLGRVLNRFSKDIYVIDELIPRVLSSFLGTLFAVISTLLVIIIVTPTFTIIILPLGIFYLLIQVITYCIVPCYNISNLM